MDEWMDGQMDRKMDGWMDRCLPFNIISPSPFGKWMD